MASFRTDDPRARYVAFAGVVVLHLLLWQIAQRIARVSHRVDTSDDALVWLRLDRPLERPRVEEPRREPRVDDDGRAAVSAPSPKGPESARPPTTAVPSPPIDWRANAARSAQLAVEAAGQERYRSFGPRKESAPDEPKTPSVFDDPPKHKLGDVGTDGAGDPVVWMNDYCYTELEKPVQTARDWISAGPGSFAPPKIRCRFPIGSAPADGTLFEHIKKPQEPPVPKAGTEMNDLPERVEELERR